MGPSDGCRAVWTGSGGGVIGSEGAFGVDTQGVLEEGSRARCEGGGGRSVRRLGGAGTDGRGRLTCLGVGGAG